MFFGEDEAGEPDVDTVDGLIEELETQAALLISVATGGERIESVKGQCRRRRQKLVPALKRRGLTYPFPWQDLWAWHGYWSSGKLPTYASRRVHVRELADPVVEALERHRSGLAVTDPGTSAVESWADLDSRIAGLAAELSQAVGQDDLQDVGRRAREVLIDSAELLARLVRATWDLAQKVTHADLDLFLAEHAPGPSREELRKPRLGIAGLRSRLPAGTNAGSHTLRSAPAAAQAAVLLARTLERLATEPDDDDED
jgi:hypothetical protein